MGYRTGRCTNDLYCSFASARQDLQVAADSKFVCPQCGKPLVEPPASAGANRMRLALMAGGGLALAGGALFAVGAFMGHGGTPAPVATAMAPRPMAAPVKPVAVAAATSAPQPGAPTPAPAQAAAAPAQAPAAGPQPAPTSFATSIPAQAAPVPAPPAKLAAAPMPPPAGSATQAVLTQSATAGRPATTRVAMIEPAPAPPPTPAPTPDTTSPAAKRAAAKAAALAAKQQADAQRAAALEQKRKDQQEKLAAAKEAAAQAAKEKAEAAAAARKAAQQAAAAPPQAPAQVATASTPAPVRAIGPSHAFSASPITGGGPQYPSIYDAEGRSGRVTVSCRIETDGHPNGCRVVSSVGGAAFGQAVMNWLGSGRVRYAPVLRDGQAVAETHQWSMSFQP